MGGQVTREEVDEVNKMMGKAMDVLTNQQEWEAGLVLLRAAQEKMVKVLPTPSLELFHSTIAVWRALWLMVGNKKLTKVSDPAFAQQLCKLNYTLMLTEHCSGSAWSAINKW